MQFLLGIVVGALVVFMGAELAKEYLTKRALERRRQHQERLNEMLSIRVRKPENVNRRMQLIDGYLVDENGCSWAPDRDGLRPAG